MMSHCRVETEAEQPTAAALGALGTNGCSCQGPNAKRVMEKMLTMGQRARS